MKPMLCEAVEIERVWSLITNGDYIFEEKYDGVRAYIEDGKLFDRRGVDITQRFPEFVGIEKLDGLDGEIVIRGKLFGEVAGRMHLREKFQIKMLSKHNPATFVAFDCFKPNADKLIARKEKLQGIVAAARCEWLEASPYWDATADEIQTMWVQIVEEQREGIVIKHKGGHYLFGDRSSLWMKCKAWKEAIATFTKLDVHPKGVRLETADGRSVNVNGAQAQEVKKLFEKNGKVTCEVQFLPQKDSDAWRFPSFMGIHTEV
jgi:ATP-dependent DNA ligase